MNSNKAKKETVFLFWSINQLSLIVLPNLYFETRTTIPFLPVTNDHKYLDDTSVFEVN